MTRDGPRDFCWVFLFISHPSVYILCVCILKPALICSVGCVCFIRLYQKKLPMVWLFIIQKIHKPLSRYETLSSYRSQCRSVWQCECACSIFLKSSLYMHTAALEKEDMAQQREAGSQSARCNLLLSGRWETQDRFHVSSAKPQR